MEDAKYTELAAKYLSGEINSAERRVLMEWVAQSDANQAFFDEMIHVWGMTGDADQIFKTDKQAAWNKVAARINPEAGREGRARGQTGHPDRELHFLSIKRNLLRIAAVILPLLAVGAWWLLSDHSPKELLVASGELTREIRLPDGTQVTLNKNSILSYREDFVERKVALTGEAYFDVARDTLHPFEIMSGQTLTRVLGTSFNIRAYPDEEEVAITVTSGKVKFQEEENQERSITLEAGEAAVFLKEEKTVQPASSLGENAAAWKNKVISADDIPLEQFLKTLDNYFGEKIEVEDPEILKCRITLTDFPDPKLEDVLLILDEVYDEELEVDSSGGKFILRGTPCNEGN